MTGLFAGFVTVILVVDLSLRSAGASVYAEAQHIDFIALPAFAPALLIPALVFSLGSALGEGRTHGSAFWLRWAATALLVVTLVITLVIDVPLNAIEAGWDVKSPPSNWMQVRDKWQFTHAIRTLCTLTAFFCLVVAVTSSRSGGQKSVAGDPGRRRVTSA